MVILITGGSGFLGQKLVRRFRQEKHIEVLAPRSTEMDLMDLNSVCRYLQRHEHVDGILHSAAYYGGIGINMYQPADMFHINSIMALNVWEAAARMKIKKVFSVGSACAYPGDVGEDLVEENLEAGPCHESVEGYGMTKRIHLVCQRQYRKQHGIMGGQAILTNLYGPHDDFTIYRSHVVGALIARFIEAVQEDKPSVKCWGDGSPIREFMYVDDAADAIFLAYEKLAMGTINIGTGIGTTVKELTEKIVKLTGYKGEVVWDTEKPNGAARKVLDVTKMREALKFEPKMKLLEGLHKTIQWYVYPTISED